MPVDQSRRTPAHPRPARRGFFAQGVLQVKLPSERELAGASCTHITLRSPGNWKPKAWSIARTAAAWFVAPPQIRYNPTRTTGFMEYVSAQDASRVPRRCT